MWVKLKVWTEARVLGMAGLTLTPGVAPPHFERASLADN